MKPLSSSEIGEGWVAKHALSGEKFDIKAIPAADPLDPIRQLVTNELRVL